jgi:hypothetical protein
MLTTSAALSRKGDTAALLLIYEFGFEAGTDDAMQLVRPGDPQTAEEMWLSYEPLTGLLDLRAWAPITQGRTDWDVATDTGPCTEPEVRRRIAEVAMAVVDFVRSRS